MKIIALFLVLLPLIGNAQVPTTRQSGPLLESARAKGYSFDIDDMAFSYIPKFVSEAKVRLVFSLKNIQKNGSPIAIGDDRNDPDRVKNIITQFDQLCRDIFDIKAAQIPEADVHEVNYEYWGFKAHKVGCSVDLPAK